jgi:hypothetical protein
MMVFENSMLRGIFGHTSDELTYRRKCQRNKLEKIAQSGPSGPHYGGWDGQGM